MTHFVTPVSGHDDEAGRGVGRTQGIAASPPTTFQVQPALSARPTFTSQVGIASGEGPRSYGAPFFAFPQVVSASSGRVHAPDPSWSTSWRSRLDGRPPTACPSGCSPQVLPPAEASLARAEV